MDELNNGVNQNVEAKKSHKGVVIFIIILIIVVICAVVGFFLYKNDMLPFLSEKSEDSTTEDVAEVDDNSLMVTDFSSLPKDNRYLKDADSQDTYKILKPYGNVEGLLNISDEDIYKVTINTENMMMFYGGVEYGATFNLLDTDGNIHKAMFMTIIDDEHLYEITISETTEGKGKEHTYKDWTYFKVNGGCTMNYLLNRYEDDYSFFTFSIGGDNFKNMSDEDFSKFIEVVIDRINIERVGEYNSDDGIEYSNFFTNVDMNNIVISDSIKMDLLANFKINLYLVQSYFDDSSSSITQNYLRLDDKDEKYCVIINETNSKTLKEYEDMANEAGYRWESVFINDEEVFAELGSDDNFRFLWIESDGEIIQIAMSNINDREDIKFEDAVNYLGEMLFK